MADDASPMIDRSDHPTKRTPTRTAQHKTGAARVAGEPDGEHPGGGRGQPAGVGRDADGRPRHHLRGGEVQAQGPSAVLSCFWVEGD